MHSATCGSSSRRRLGGGTRGWDMPDTVPQNGGYMVAAYVVAAVILISYAGSLYLRARRSLRPQLPPRLRPARMAVGGPSRPEGQRLVGCSVVFPPLQPPVGLP